MRIRLKIPKPELYTIDIPIKIGDINYGGHLGNDRVLSIAHEARIQFFKSLGYKSEKDFGDSKGIIVTDAAIMYLAEGFHGDVLSVSISVDDITSRGMDIYHHLVLKGDEKEIARVKTGIVFFDYIIRKVGYMPEEFNTRLRLLISNKTNSPK